MRLALRTCGGASARVGPALAVLSVLLPACVSCSRDGETGPRGGDPPEAVSDLAVTASTDSSLTLSWHAPFDDGPEEQVLRYELRHDTYAFDEEGWAAAKVVSGLSRPRAAGQPETFVFRGLEPYRSYAFALKTADEEDQWSPVSNSTSSWTLPRFLPQSSTAAVLQNLRMAYCARDIGQHDRLFEEDFTFVFHSDGPVPETWGWAEERAAAHTLLGHPGVGQIQIAFEFDPAVPSNEEIPGTWKVLVQNVNLDLNLTLPDGLHLLHVEDGWARMYLRRHPEEPAGDGNATWRILRWDDEPEDPAFPGSQDGTTWGDVKKFLP